MALQHFHPATQDWFAAALGAPTPAQCRGWDAIRRGEHTLIAAPTGSGKTLAAFLTAIDQLTREGLQTPLPDETRVVFVSPLKALSADVHKNLAEPRRGIREAAGRLGLDAPKITAAVRTGDTTASERAAMLRTPPHILVTTPESLYLLLTSERSRQMLRTVRAVIVDEIHAVIGTRRGAHLALSLERLQEVARAPLLRIGLSATQKPIADVARFLSGTAGGDVTIVDEGHRRAMDLGIELPGAPLEAVMSHEVWEEYYDRLTALIEAHRTTLVFVNTRRMAERVARHLTGRLGEAAVTAHHGSLSKDKRLDAEMRLKGGQLRALVATASLELGIDIGSVDLVCQIGSPHRIATFIQRVGRSGHTIAGTPKGRLFPVSRDDLIECTALLRAVRRGALDRIVDHDAPLDVLAQQIVAEASCRDYEDDELFALMTRAWPYRALSRGSFDAVVRMLSEGFDTRRGRRGALLYRDEIQGRVRGRRSARLLAMTSGGAIPEVADYRVVLEPDETFVGTLNEDFAIESSAGDVFQLGNASWRVLQVLAGTVRVADAKGAPPTLPFWLGEAPARSDELSRAVSDLRADVDLQLDSRAPAVEWLQAEAGVPAAAAEQAIGYLESSRQALGVLPSQATLVLERFFDESGGMQLVLHAPFGSRINKAWGLALRKRFCRQFNFELQAAATEDALMLSLGPQHSFPLADVFRYLHPASVRDVLVQAFLDAPVFKTRWRWNTTIALAVPRSRGGRKIAPQLQRMLADDLMAAVFPDAAACLENIPGDRQIPDHPLVSQTVRDCLEEAMDIDGLIAVLTKIHAGDLTLVARDTPEPSPLAHEILNARPYAFLDDAPLEERRAHAVMTRRASDPASARDLGALDRDAIDRVRQEVRPDPRDADELHDALLTSGFLLAGDCAAGVAPLFERLAATRRAAWLTPPGDGPRLMIAAERLPEFQRLFPGAIVDPVVVAPASRLERAWTRSEAIVEILRGRLAMVGPTTAAELAESLSVGAAEVDEALLALEGSGMCLRGSFRPATPGHVRPQPEQVEWCDRRLLARIHRYTIDRLRAEIEPVTPAGFMRFLFAWQHVDPAYRLTGIEGLRAAVGLLDGFEVAAAAWERSVLPARVERYEPSMLDTLCLTGEVGWARLSVPDSSDPPTRLVGATPVALFLHEHGGMWRALRRNDGPRQTGSSDCSAGTAVSAAAARVLETLRARGASFTRELAVASNLEMDTVHSGLAELVSAGLAVSDGFAGLRAIVHGAAGPSGGASRARPAAGRWWAIDAAGDAAPAEQALDAHAWVLLRRYGVVFRRLLAREPNAAPWRDLIRVYRRLEARGEVRGGRFVSGVSGEQFALPDAVERLREHRRPPPDCPLIVISAADPLNLTGVLTAEERIRASGSGRIAYHEGVAVAVLEGEFMRLLNAGDATVVERAATALTGRRLPAVAGGYVGPASVVR